MRAGHLDGKRAFNLVLRRGVHRKRSEGLSQLLQQRLRLLQVARTETLSEPPVNRSKQFTRLLHLALVAPEARETHSGAEFKRLGLLLACPSRSNILSQRDRQAD